MRIVITFVSGVVTLGFASLGLATAAFGDSGFVRVFGIVVGAYAIAVTMLLLKAWRSPSPRLPRWAAVVVAGFVVLWVGGSFDRGILSGLEIVMLLLVGLAAALNWFAVRLIVRKDA